MRQHRCHLCDGVAWLQVEPLVIDQYEYSQVARCRCSIDLPAEPAPVRATRKAP